MKEKLREVKREELGSGTNCNDYQHLFEGGEAQDDGAAERERILTEELIVEANEDWAGDEEILLAFPPA